MNLISEKCSRDTRGSTKRKPFKEKKLNKQKVKELIKMYFSTTLEKNIIKNILTTESEL